MKEIEIRQKKGSFYYTIIFLPLIVIGFAYYVFLSENPQVTSGTKYTFVALLLYSIFIIYTAINRRKENKPALIISEFSIEIFGDFKRNLYLWQDIKSWKIEFDEGSNYLVLEIDNLKKHISVEGLDKTPEEIKDILHKCTNR